MIRSFLAERLRDDPTLSLNELTAALNAWEREVGRLETGEDWAREYGVRYVAVVGSRGVAAPLSPGLRDEIRELLGGAALDRQSHRNSAGTQGGGAAAAAK